MGVQERKLLRALQNNSRRSLRELAEELGMPVSTAHAKIARLEKEGFISGYRATLDERKLGFGTVFFVLISLSCPLPKGCSARSVAEEIASMPNVVDVHLTTGEFDVLVKAKARSLDEARVLSTESLPSVKGVAKARAVISFDSVKENGGLDIGGQQR